MKKKKPPAWMLPVILIGTLLYLVFPRDVIPDYIPVAGLMEDFLLVFFVFYLFLKKKRERRGTADSSAGSGRFRQTGADGEERASPGSEEDPYEVLGVSPLDSLDTIRKKYRTLISKYHPDKVDNLGDEFKEMAARKTVALNRAYQRIKSERKTF